MANIFISYRRGDDPGNTGRLFDRLQEAFKPEQLFMDVDSIEPGLDFVHVLGEKVAQCDVLIAVIGKGWLDARDAAGARRLNNPEDFVRVEIESALNQGKRVIPVLVGEARMPQSDELPESIKPLARRNAVRLTHERFRADAEGLVKALRQTLDDAHRRAREEEQRRLEQAAKENAATLQAQRAFESAKRADDAGAVADFLAAHPGSALTAEARALQAKLIARDEAYEAAMAGDDAAALEAFLASYPSGQTAERARRRLRQLQPKMATNRRWKAIIAAGAVVAACITAVVIWPEIIPFQSTFGPPPLTEPAPAPSSAPPKKVEDRFAPGSQQAPATVPPSGSQSTPPAQKVVLYEEDPADPNGKRFVGSAIWRTETVTPGPGLPPELAIRADVEVPERKLAITWSLRRNTDKSLPASHTVEIMFKLPSDFPFGGIGNVPGILMKANENSRGAPLSGHAVKVTSGYYLIGLSDTDPDKSRNIELLKERGWIDVPVVYSTNRRAILAIDKGVPGERVFAEAFKAWENCATGCESAASTAPAGMDLRRIIAAIQKEPAPLPVETGPVGRAAGKFVVQVSSQKTEDEANSSFRGLLEKFPNELGGRRAVVQRADLGPKGIVYRVHVGPFASSDEASRFCASFKTAGGQCVVP